LLKKYKSFITNYNSKKFFNFYFFFFSFFKVSILYAKNRPNVKEISIGRVAPIPSQMAAKVPTKKKVIAIGRRNGF
jgi:hypothetical protein